MKRFPASAIIVFSEMLCLILLILSYCTGKSSAIVNILPDDATPSEAEKYIKWVEFNVTSEALNKAFRYDVDTCQSAVHLNWIELLACLGARYGGDFSRYKSSDMDKLAERIKSGERIQDITADMKYYNYYFKAYSAVLGGMVGTYQVEIPAAKAPQSALNKKLSVNICGINEYLPAGLALPDKEPIPDKVWVTKYGLKAFFPLAKGYPYSGFDDFGAARSYGFKRQHLGHDFMGQTGTPIIAVESGYVEALGWNQYGGWRIGIRSFDKKRYYYYAHLRQNYPYHKTLTEGSIVQAGDVIGYLGHTGYSSKENTNNINEPHLHFGIQLIFDESQKESNNEIWIDCYELSKFLALNKSEVIKNADTKEYNRIYSMSEQK